MRTYKTLENFDQYSQYFLSQLKTLQINLYD